MIVGAFKTRASLPIILTMELVCIHGLVRIVVQYPRLFTKRLCLPIHPSVNAVVHARHSYNHSYQSFLLCFISLSFLCLSLYYVLDAVIYTHVRGERDAERKKEEERNSL